MKNRLITHAVIGKNIKVYYPELKIVGYTRVVKILDNFWARVLASTRVLAAAILRKKQKKNDLLKLSAHRTEIKLKQN